MSLEHERVTTWREFADEVVPRIATGGYNCIQLMAVQEHPYYGSFGYHVSSFFAPSSRYGTPDDLKYLVDTCHGFGLQIIMDIVHSHAVKNELEGIARLDGTRSQFFHEGERGEHSAWDSLCFDYGKNEVLHFLLSNCKYWLDEFRFDGFRFDGVTSMLYYDHGLGEAFTDYGKYFSGQVDPDAFVYLKLANELIHTVAPQAITVAEDMSGLPGLAAPIESGGAGFDYRLAMGVPDFWFKVLEQPDDNWNMDQLYYELTNRRSDEKAISYIECHDQAIVGGKH